MPAVHVWPSCVPDEQRTAPSTMVDVASVDGQTVARFTCEPGWRWSEHVAPVAGADRCQALHVGAVRSGAMGVRAADSTEAQVTVGDEPCVVVESRSGATYETPPA